MSGDAHASADSLDQHAAGDSSSGDEKRRTVSGMHVRGDSHGATDDAMKDVSTGPSGSKMDRAPAANPGDLNLREASGEKGAPDGVGAHMHTDGAGWARYLAVRQHQRHPKATVPHARNDLGPPTLDGHPPRRGGHPGIRVNNLSKMTRQ